LHGELMLAITLPDGSHGTIAAVATDIFGTAEQAPHAGVAILSAEGLRRLRGLVATKPHGPKNRGARRQAL
jgi:hypothetical protein